MRTFTILKIILSQLLWLFLCALPAAGMSAEDAPESVTIDYLQDLYEEVNFDHLMHSDTYDCNACHHNTSGTGSRCKNCKKCHASSTSFGDVSCSGCHQYKNIVPTATTETAKNNIYHIDKPGLKGALHLQCLGCHRIENGPVGCLECHNFTPSGRKRFAIKN